jgi:hypothetical protein
MDSMGKVYVGSVCHRINQFNSIKYNDARDDVHVCSMTKLIILGCYNKQPLSHLFFIHLAGPSLPTPPPQSTSPAATLHLLPHPQCGVGGGNGGTGHPDHPSTIEREASTTSATHGRDGDLLQSEGPIGFVRCTLFPAGCKPSYFKYSFV